MLRETPRARRVVCSAGSSRTCAMHSLEWLAIVHCVVPHLRRLGDRGGQQISASQLVEALRYRRRPLRRRVAYRSRRQGGALACCDEARRTPEVEAHATLLDDRARRAVQYLGWANVAHPLWVTKPRFGDRKACDRVPAKHNARPITPIAQVNHRRARRKPLAEGNQRDGIRTSLLRCRTVA